MEETKIDSRHKNISEILFNSKHAFKIPEFQRDFVWSKNEIKELLNDFMEDSDNFERETNELSGYLLGNIVLIGSNQDMEVIDGQQRLTTITIIFKALQTYAKIKCGENSQFHETWNTYSTTLPKGYSLVSDFGDFKGLKIQHASSLSFGDFYARLMRDEINEDYKIENNSDQNIKSIFDYVLNFIEEEKLSEKQIIRFINYLNYNVYLIMTIAPSEGKAFQLFEVLNDRGRSLEPLDLIKNLALKTIVSDSDETLKSEFLTNWKEFSQNLEYPLKKDRRKKKISASKFLTNYFLAVYGNNIKKDNLLKFFKTKLKSWSPSELVNFSKELAVTSNTFSKLEVQEYSTFTKKNENILKILYEILSVEQAKTMLIPFYKLSNESDKEKVIDAIIRYVSSVLFSFNQTNVIEAFIPQMIKNYHKLDKKNGTINHTIKFINTEIDKYTDDIKTSLSSRRFENKNGSTSTKAILLYRLLEGYFCERVEAIHKDQSKKYTIEHILSQKIDVQSFSELNFENEEEFLQYKNKIGNLTLIYSTDNSSLGNKSFKNKIPHYDNDVNFYLTKKLATNLKTEVKNGQDTKLINKINSYVTTPNLKSNEQHFTKNMIDKRSNEITNIIIDLVKR
ncbi:hypothetical protein AST03_06865 [Staphylococcus equorum]|uniref:DUF262 domain-containing protein n=1 Tax=Staphylococcus equorum TaxID=246432 RepID=UPI000853EA9F|nr:DUF262 domain-containing protein [Staphylococcus equorum]OEK79679.1 hypothetical protein AST03_06865 [Staphylococcus equorum]